MADERMYQEGVYVSDGIGLFEVLKVQRINASAPKQQRQVILQDCKTEERLSAAIPDKDFNKKYVYTCGHLTDEELYLRYKAIGQEYKPEPVKIPLLSHAHAAKRKNPMCL